MKVSGRVRLSRFLLFIFILGLASLSFALELEQDSVESDEQDLLSLIEQRAGVRKEVVVDPETGLEKTVLYVDREKLDEFGEERVAKVKEELVRERKERFENQKVFFAGNRTDQEHLKWSAGEIAEARRVVSQFHECMNKQPNTTQMARVCVKKFYAARGCLENPANNEEFCGSKEKPIDKVIEEFEVTDGVPLTTFMGAPQYMCFGMAFAVSYSADVYITRDGCVSHEYKTWVVKFQKFADSLQAVRVIETSDRTQPQVFAELSCKDARPLDERYTQPTVHSEKGLAEMLVRDSFALVSRGKTHEGFYRLFDVMHETVAFEHPVYERHLSRESIKNTYGSMPDLILEHHISLHEVNVVHVERAKEAYVLARASVLLHVKGGPPRVNLWRYELRVSLLPNDRHSPILFWRSFTEEDLVPQRKSSASPPSSPSPSSATTHQHTPHEESRVGTGDPPNVIRYAPERGPPPPSYVRLSTGEVVLESDPRAAKGNKDEL